MTIGRDTRGPTLHGGCVLQVGYIGAGGQFAEIWTIHPTTLAERVITVRTLRKMPQPQDTVAWVPGCPPEWWPRGATYPRAYFERIGPCFDPLIRTPRTA